MYVTRGASRTPRSWKDPDLLQCRSRIAEEVGLAAQPIRPKPVEASQRDLPVLLDPARNQTPVYGKGIRKRGPFIPERPPSGNGSRTRKAEPWTGSAHRCRRRAVPDRGPPSGTGYPPARDGVCTPSGLLPDRPVGRHTDGHSARSLSRGTGYGTPSRTFLWGRRAAWAKRSERGECPVRLPERDGVPQAGRGMYAVPNIWGFRSRRFSANRAVKPNVPAWGTTLLPDRSVGRHLSGTGFGARASPPNAGRGLHPVPNI